MTGVENGRSDLPPLQISHGDKKVAAKLDLNAPPHTAEKMKRRTSLVTHDVVHKGNSQEIMAIRKFPSENTASSFRRKIGESVISDESAKLGKQVSLGNEERQGIRSGKAGKKVASQPKAQSMEEV